jgi:DNA-3-methyladenine glycosylase
MYAEGGVSYVYLCYGIHRLFNIITNHRDVPHAILVRAIEPLDGIKTMLMRRNLSVVKRNLTGGPGLVTQALGITLAHNGMDLSGNQLWIEDRNYSVQSSDIISSARVGVKYAGADARKPWRFRLKTSSFTSPSS